MPEFYVFHATTGSQVGITDDPSGAKLPTRRFGDWQPMKTVTIKPGGGPLIGADSDDVIDGIGKDGYYLWPRPTN